MTTEIENEVNEDIRRQELEQFWKENGSWIITGVILAVLFTAAMTFWRQHVYQRNLAETSQLFTLINAADADKIDAYANESDRDHAVIARFAAAALHAKRKEPAKAVAVYAEIEGMTGIDRSYRDLAKLLRLEESLETAEPGALHRELKGLMGGTWRFSALEMDALVYARQGQDAEAARDLTEIATDSTAPEEQRQRASTLREIYTGAK